MTEEKSKQAERKKIKVLFVCVGNACRSPMAESIARSIAADVIVPSSAGVYPLGEVPALTRQTLVKNGYPIEGLGSKPILREDWQAAELVINMSGMDRERIFTDASKVEDWDVADPYGADPALYQRIMVEIEERVRGLTERLRRKQPEKSERS